MPKKVDLEEFQTQVAEWNKKNFKRQPSSNFLLGIQEELGELTHAHLKGSQHIRYSRPEIREMKSDAIGDIVIFLAVYCAAEGFYLSTCIEEAWAVVSKRNWKDQ